MHLLKRQAATFLRCVLLLPLAGAPGFAQEKPEAPEPRPLPNAAQATAGQASSAAGPAEISLAKAIELARANSTVYNAAQAEAGSAREDRTQARDALLPQASYTNEYLYTQANELGQVRFIANNAVHEYLSQANVHESIDLAALAAYRKTAAAAAVAKAKAQIAARGLVVTVAQSYFLALAAQNKLEAARRGADEGDRFFELTQQLEQGGEVAHSDTIKAELQAQDRRRQFEQAQLALLNARLDLAVLLFPDLQDTFVLTENLAATVPLPTLEEVQQQAARDNPDLRAALETLNMSRHDVTASRAEYLPSLGLDYFYGIDAAQFSANSTVNGQKLSNLGSSVLASLNFPLWNWGATQSRVRQAELRQKQAKLELSFTERRLIAEVRSLYAEAQTSLNQLSGLERSASLAAESQRLTTLRYKGGEATVLEVVDAQTVLVQATNNYQDGAVRYRVALANLQTLTGVLLNP